MEESHYLSTLALLDKSFHGDRNFQLQTGKNLQEAVYWIIVSSLGSWIVHAQITTFSTGFTIQNIMFILARNTFSFIDYLQSTTPSHLQGILVMWEDSSHVPSITQKHSVHSMVWLHYSPFIYALNRFFQEFHHILRTDHKGMLGGPPLPVQVSLSPLLGDDQLWPDAWISDS